MRKTLLIAIPVILSVAISACGNKGKAKVAAAIATGDKGTIKKAGNQTVDDINVKITELRQKHGFTGMSEDMSGKAMATVERFNPFSTRSVSENETILKTLKSIKQDAEAVMKAGQKSGAKELEAKGKDVFERAIAQIDVVQADLKKAQEKASKDEADAKAQKDAVDWTQPTLVGP